MSKPKIYATCPAGCLWESVHYDDFQKSAAFIKQTPNADGTYSLTKNKRYKIRAMYDQKAWGCSIRLLFNYYDIYEERTVTKSGSYTIELPAYSDYADFLTIRVADIFTQFVSVDSSDSKIIVAVEINGEIQYQDTGYLTLVNDQTVRLVDTLVSGGQETFLFNDGTVAFSSEGAANVTVEGETLKFS